MQAGEQISKINKWACSFIRYMRLYLMMRRENCHSILSSFLNARKLKSNLVFPLKHSTHSNCQETCFLCCNRGFQIKVHIKKCASSWISTTLITLGTGTHMEWSTTPIEISLFIILQLLTINKPSALLHSLSRIAPSWVSFQLLSGDLYSST